VPERREEARMRTYTVEVRRDERGWWVASVRGVRGCHTQGRTLREVERRIREALALFVSDARHARVRLALPAALERIARARQALRVRAERERRREQEALVRAVRELTEERGLSLRDVGELLHVSHQRVQQLRHTA
jgi:predicted RNase H-like HicB family nuclease